VGNKLQLLARHGQNDCATALGRKNFLFAGGERAAAAYTLIETAKSNGRPEAYLREVIG
jgi:hypothetical protein